MLLNMNPFGRIFHEALLRGFDSILGFCNIPKAPQLLGLSFAIS